MKIEGHPWYQRVLVAWSEKISAYYADKIIAASSFLYSMYKESFPKKPVHILPNGVSDEWFTPVKEKMHSKRILFMGAINRKNILEPLFDVLPNVIAQYPDIKILIMGNGTYLNYFKEKAGILGITKNTIFTGWLALTDVKDTFSPGDIGYSYMPNERTVLAASNMKVSQYMARGVVPLVSNIGDLPSFVDHGRIGYIAQSNNRTDLEKTILYALGDADIYDKSKNAQVYAKEKYNWSILAAETEAFLGISSAVKKDVKEKTIYIVSTNTPRNSGGAEIRNFHLLKQLSKKSHTTIDLFCIADNSEAVDALKREPNITVHPIQKKKLTPLTFLKAILFKRVQPAIENFRISGVGEIFYAACQEKLPDVVHIEQISGYYCIRKYIPWLKKQGVKIVLDTHNIEGALFEQSLELFSSPKRIVGKWLVPHLQKVEIEATKQADIVIACSNNDADYFKQINKNVFIVPNGVDCKEFVPVKKKDNNKKILFIGGVKYPPNADAVKFYIHEIYPHLKKKDSAISTTIIGATPEWLKKEGVQDDSIKGTGFVEDIRPYLAESAIGICPVRYGSGTRLKILTYMAAGLPVVSASKGAEGIEKNNGIAIADAPEAFADTILDILYKNMQYDEMSAAGREFVLTHYDWDVVGKALLSIYP
jgi:glycosyltransferase involved in cell wall biosynthesis